MRIYVDFLRAVEGGFFLRKKPLEGLPSVYSNSQTAIGGSIFLNASSNTSQLDLNTISCAARVYAEMVRFLLLLTAVSLITMPVTQLIWTWDHFPQGGQDFELSALAILTCLLLVLLLAAHFRQSISSLLATGSLFSLICADRELAGTARNGRFPVLLGRRSLCPVLSIYNLPLQI
jgi:hypothetical protein